MKHEAYKSLRSAVSTIGWRKPPIYSHILLLITPSHINETRPARDWTIWTWLVKRAPEMNMKKKNEVFLREFLVSETVLFFFLSFPFLFCFPTSTNSCYPSSLHISPFSPQPPLFPCSIYSRAVSGSLYSPSSFSLHPRAYIRYFLLLLLICSISV